MISTKQSLNHHHSYHLQYYPPIKPIIEHILHIGRYNRMNRLLAAVLCLLLAQQALALHITHLKEEENATKSTQPANTTVNATSDSNETSGLFFEITKALKGAIEQSQAEADKNATTVDVIQNRLNEALDDAREELVHNLNKTDDSGKARGDEIQDNVLGTVDNALNLGKLGLMFYDGQVKDVLSEASNDTGLFSDAPIGGFVNGTDSNERGAVGFIDQINNYYDVFGNLIKDSLKSGFDKVKGLLGGEQK